MASSSSRRLKRADPTTIQDKFMVGYQGWFTCAGDGEPVGPGHHGWLHWFTYPIPDGGQPNTDLWPDVSEYSPSELFPAPGLSFKSGEQAFLFSSRHPRTVQRHFHWMAEHGVDGAFLQRFVGQCDIEAGNEGIRRQRDEVGDLVRAAAEKEGRVFAIMYDVSGVAPERIQQVIEQDWIHLVRKKGILDSPNYLREKGKPVVALWGFGFAGSGHDPSVVRAITSFIRKNTPGGAYIKGGTPAHWRTSEHDADGNREFVNVWLEEFDAISPWTIGRYGTLEEADRFAEEKIKGDLELITRNNEEFQSGRSGHRKVDYIPVVHPGSSGFNLSQGKWQWNGAARRGGQYLWRQVWNVRRLGVRTIYGAMWDEYDEGTAFMPVVSHKRQLPVSEKFNFMALDEDGYDLPPDWYMRICGFAAEGLRSERMILETFPSKELQDYWSTRPKYEEERETNSATGSGSSELRKEDKGESWEDWQKTEKGKGTEDEPPPPPYSLEVEEAPASQAMPAEPQLHFAAPSTTGAASIQMPPPPVAPHSTRPTFSSSLSHMSSVPGNVGPPLVIKSSRPQMGTADSSYRTHSENARSRSSSRSISPQSVCSLTNAFSRQSITSSPSCQHEAPPSHSDHPTGQRPVSSAYPGFRPPPSPPRRSESFGSSSQPSMIPTTPGFAPSPASQAPSASPGPWSQAPWPPPEWGMCPPSQPPVHQQPYAAYSSPDPPQHAGYAPVYQAPPPSLAPRPPSASPPSSYGPPRPGFGGFQFPEARPALSQHDFYASPAGPPPPQPHSQYGMGYPGAQSQGPPYGAPSPPPPPGPGGYPSYGPVGGYASGGSSGEAFRPPPMHPAYGSRPSSGPVSAATNYLGQALGAIGGSRVQGLTQTASEKLLNKFKK